MGSKDNSLSIEFAPGTSLYRERDLVSQLPILRNGPAGTFVMFPTGLRVSLPTDQIVNMDDTGGCARVAFGGMHFSGVDDGRLISCSTPTDTELLRTPMVVLRPDAPFPK